MILSMIFSTKRYRIGLNISEKRKTLVLSALKNCKNSMSMVKGNSITIALLATILICGSCARTQDCLGTSFPHNKISRALKQVAVSEDSVFVFDLQSLFEERIDSVFYLNGLLLSSEIAEITGLTAREREATTTLLDNQSRIILFSAGQVMYYETFSMSFCLITPNKSNRTEYGTIAIGKKYSKKEFEIGPLQEVR